MNTKDIISQILEKNPEANQKQIFKDLETEKNKTGGLIGEETLLRLIAARYGVDIPQEKIIRKLSLKQLVSGLNDVTVSGRIVSIFPPRTFNGERCGKVASLIVAEKETTLRVVLWNDNVNLIESGQLKVGQVIRFFHGYTRKDRNGQLELHLGRRSQVAIES